MSKQRSFWDWLFGNSCCSSREKDKNYDEEKFEGKAKTTDKTTDKTITESFEEDYDEPGSGLSEVGLGENSEYARSLTGDDGSVEIR